MFTLVTPYTCITTPARPAVAVPATNIYFSYPLYLPEHPHTAQPWPPMLLFSVSLRNNFSQSKQKFRVRCHDQRSRPRVPEVTQLTAIDCDVAQLTELTKIAQLTELTEIAQLTAVRSEVVLLTAVDRDCTAEWSWQWGYTADWEEHLWQQLIVRYTFGSCWLWGYTIDCSATQLTVNLHSWLWGNTAECQAKQLSGRLHCWLWDYAANFEAAQLIARLRSWLRGYAAARKSPRLTVRLHSWYGSQLLTGYGDEILTKAGSDQGQKFMTIKQLRMWQCYSIQFNSNSNAFY